MKLDERFWLTIGVLSMVFVYDIFIHLVPTHLDPNVVSFIAGALNSGGFITTVQWWFGSSKGSQDKDATIQQLSAH